MPVSQTNHFPTKSSLFNETTENQYPLKVIRMIIITIIQMKCINSDLKVFSQYEWKYFLKIVNIRMLCLPLPPSFFHAHTRQLPNKYTFFFNITPFLIHLKKGLYLIYFIYTNLILCQKYSVYFSFFKNSRFKNVQIHLTKIKQSKIKS